jgi:hypothetical protein
MIEHEPDPYVEWIAREARRPVATDPLAKVRLMAAIRSEPLPARSRFDWRWLLEPRTVAMSPLRGFALAAGLVGIGVLIGVTRIHRDGQPLAGRPTVVAGTDSQLPVIDTVRVIKFVLVAPHATAVSLVGDFNDWDAKATPMTRTPTGGTWSVAVRLRPGRHVYAFVVNGATGAQWVADPSAPLAPEDDLGAPSSVVLVGGSSS